MTWDGDKKKDMTVSKVEGVRVAAHIYFNIPSSDFGPAFYTQFFRGQIFKREIWNAREHFFKIIFTYTLKKYYKLPVLDSKYFARFFQLLQGVFEKQEPNLWRDWIVLRYIWKCSIFRIIQCWRFSYHLHTLLW